MLVFYVMFCLYAYVQILFETIYSHFESTNICRKCKENNLGIKNTTEILKNDKLKIFPNFTDVLHSTMDTRPQPLASVDSFANVYRLIL